MTSISAQLSGRGLPKRALLVAPTVERAATLGTAFDDAIAVTLDDFSELLVTEGDETSCVAISGVPVRGRRLAAVTEAILAACPPHVHVVLDVSGPAAQALAEDDGESLRGLALVDRIDLESVPCLHLVRDGDPLARPGVAAALALRPPEAGTPSEPAGEAAALRAEVKRLRAELDAFPAAREGTTDAGVPNLPVPNPWQRLRRSGLLVPLMALTIAAAVLCLAALQSVTFIEAGVAALVVLGPLHLVIGWRAAARTRQTLARLGGSVATSAAADKDLARAIADVAGRLARIERALAVATASTVDTAQSVVGLHERLRGERPPG